MSVVPTDIRYAVRRWVARPGLAITVVLTLGLGIGATTAIFSVVDGVLLRPLPWREPDRLVSVYIVRQAWRTDPVFSFSWDTGLLSWPDVRDLQAQAETFDVRRRLAAGRRPGRAGWETGDVAQALNATSNFLATLGTGPYRGRTFTPAEDDTASDSILVSVRDVAAPVRRRSTASSDVKRDWTTCHERSSACLRRHFEFEGEPPEFLLPFGNLTAGERSENYNLSCGGAPRTGCDAGVRRRVGSRRF